MVPVQATTTSASGSMNGGASAITGLILAGGRGSRLGGQDKGLLPYRGRPLVEWVLAGLKPQVGAILISANRNPAAYARYGHPVLSDTLPDYPGPLAGIREGLKATSTPWLLAVPCDMPHLPADCAARLMQAALAQHAQVAYARAAGDSHYAVLLMQRSLAAALEAYLQAGGRSVHGFAIRQAALAVDFDDAQAFANLNTPQDLGMPP